jgi:folate-binding protein YgfZ
VNAVEGAGAAEGADADGPGATDGGATQPDAPPLGPLLTLLERAGGVRASYHGGTLIRHFGDPAAEYRAATGSAAVFDRSHRARLLVKGRAPGQMLNGVLTGTLPGAPAAREGEVLAGTATYHAVLTPKGKMITDLWLLLLGDEAADGFLLDVPVAGRAGLVEHLRKSLPPRLARVEDVSQRTGMITVAGPGAADVVSRLALGLRVEVPELEAMAEGEWRAAGPSAVEGLVVIRTGEVWPDAYSVVGPAEAVAALWRASVDAGALPAGLGVWSTLRVEAGRPAFGTDMDERTIPVEAGIDARAIDHRKGCYTGQEVIVRIRDRGHVNRHLRRLELGDVPAPAPGTELFAAEGDPAKPVAWITSAVESPRFGGVVALAYVRRGVDAVSVGGRSVAVEPPPL